LQEVETVCELRVNGQLKTRTLSVLALEFFVDEARRYHFRSSHGQYVVMFSARS